MKYSKEKEKEYYNQKLIKDGFRNEMKEFGENVRKGNYKFPWKDFFITFIGVFAGSVISEKIGVDRLISDRSLSFCAEVLIIAAGIVLTHAAVLGFSKLIKPKTE